MSISEVRLVRWAQIEKRVPLCRHQVQNLIRKGKFPEPVRLGPNSVAWPLDEIDRWIQERMAARKNSPKAPTATPE